MHVYLIEVQYLVIYILTCKRINMFKVWRDLKSRTSMKAKDLRKAKMATGNKAISKPELTEFELRILGIIGAEYVEGSKYCADSIPEEEVIYQKPLKS